MSTRDWPIELPAADAPPPGTTSGRMIASAVSRAGSWLASFPATELRFDAAIGLTMIRKTVDSSDLRQAWRRARAAADRDDDNPMHRLWDSDHRADADAVRGWVVPDANGKRPNVNRVVIEALYCAEYGLRPAVLTYLAGRMRDGGGYHTTHALWALTIAYGNGCIDSATFGRISRDLQSELIDAQPATFVPEHTLDIDLFAERVLMLLLGGCADPIVDQWIQRLLELQGEDGSWGIAAEGEPVYFRYHATIVAGWALCEWCSLVQKRSGQR